MTERPNTISGLSAKRDELVKLRTRYQAEITKLTVDIDHLEAAIRLFETETPRLPAHMTAHRAKKGTVKRFVLEALRTSTEPLTSRQIADMWLADRGLEANHETYLVIRKRIGACIKTCANQGFIESCGLTTDHGESGPYKLWAIRQ